MKLRPRVLTRPLQHVRLLNQPGHSSRAVVSIAGRSSTSFKIWRLQKSIGIPPTCKPTSLTHCSVVTFRTFVGSKSPLILRAPSSRWPASQLLGPGFRVCVSAAISDVIASLGPKGFQLARYGEHCPSKHDSAELPHSPRPPSCTPCGDKREYPRRRR